MDKDRIEAVAMVVDVLLIEILVTVMDEVVDIITMVDLDMVVIIALFIIQHSYQNYRYINQRNMPVSLWNKRRWLHS